MTFPNTNFSNFQSEHLVQDWDDLKTNTATNPHSVVPPFILPSLSELDKISEDVQKVDTLTKRKAEQEIPNIPKKQIAEKTCHETKESRHIRHAKKIDSSSDSSYVPPPHIQKQFSVSPPPKEVIDINVASTDLSEISPVSRMTAFEHVLSAPLHYPPSPLINQVQIVNGTHMLAPNLLNILINCQILQSTLSQIIEFYNILVVTNQEEVKMPILLQILKQINDFQQILEDSRNIIIDTDSSREIYYKLFQESYDFKTKYNLICKQDHYFRNHIQTLLNQIKVKIESNLQISAKDLEPHISAFYEKNPLNLPHINGKT